MYGPPEGLFLLALYDEVLAGGVGFRKLDSDICEMKRLFVYEDYRGKGIGRRLCHELIENARKAGYGKMRLDTLKRLKAATGLYVSLGFREIAPYRYNPDPTAIFMELELV
jgi:GNAT superfamily N-acetyltransferase